jgi:hypothetical protein
MQKSSLSCKTIGSGTFLQSLFNAKREIHSSIVKVLYNPCVPRGFVEIAFITLKKIIY